MSRAGPGSDISIVKNSIVPYWPPFSSLHCHSSLEGEGVELIALVRSALGVLNRLLQAWPAGAAASPVARSLAGQPPGRSERHLLATVAQYVYHRHDSQLTGQATTLLKNVAAVSQRKNSEIHIY